MYTYVIVNKLTQHPQFNNINQRSVATKITLDILTDDDVLFPMDTCDAGHNTETTAKWIVWSSINTLLKNYCKKENNILAEKKVKSAVKKRKLDTLDKK